MSIRKRLREILQPPVKRTYEQQAQIARSLEYRISIKKDGHVSKNRIYPEVPEVLFGDPVNFRFPLSPIERIRNSITEFNHGGMKKEYNLAEWRLIGKRIGSAYPGWAYNKRSKLIQPINPLAQQKHEGGPGSGHHGHAGRPGKRGGSAPGKGGGGGKAKGAGEAKAPSYRDPSNPATEFTEKDVNRFMKEYEDAGVDEDRTEYSPQMLYDSDEMTPEVAAALYVDLQKTVTPSKLMPKAEARAEEWYKGAKEKQAEGIAKWKASVGKGMKASTEFKALDKSGNLENMAQHDLRGLFKVYPNASESEIRKLHRQLQKATGKQDAVRFPKGRGA